MSETLTLDDLLACPRCDRTPLAPTDGGFACNGCKTRFESLDGVPWLFAEPDAAMAEWRQRLKLALHQLAHECQRLAGELKKDSLLPATRERLTHLETACLRRST